MLNPENDRLDYCEMLRPPSGYKLSRAVATTFSLDLETLVAVSLPLGLEAGIERDGTKNPVDQMCALKSVLDKIVVFCDVGQIKVPAFSPLLPLLDRVVVPVSMKKVRGKGIIWPSFHPKTWLLEYAPKDAKGEYRWRFIISSRNLSKDNSWDLTIAFDGMKRGAGSDKARCADTTSIARCLEFLENQVLKKQGKAADKAARAIVSRLAKDIKDVEFYPSRPFNSVVFIPLGLNGNKVESRSRERFEFKGFDEVLVISPFLTPDLIGRLNKESSDRKEVSRILVTRRDELPRLPSDNVDAFRKYVLRDYAISGEEGSGDIHAKMLFARKGKESSLYLGSMNYTNSGIGRNAEMIVELKSSDGKLTAETLLAEMCRGKIGEPGCPLEEVTDLPEPENDDSEDAKRLEEAKNAMRAMCHQEMSATIKEEDGKCHVAVTVVVKAKELEGVDIGRFKMAPYGWRHEKRSLPSAGELKFVFSFDRVEDVTSLYELEYAYEGGKLLRIVQIPTEGIPEERDDAICRSVIKDESALLRYLTMILADDLDCSLGDDDDGGEIKGGDFNSMYDSSVSCQLYENMLIAAADERNRSRIGSALEMIMQREKDERTAGIIKICEVFLRVIKPKKGRRRNV